MWTKEVTYSVFFLLNYFCFRYLRVTSISRRDQKMASSKQATGGHFDLPTECHNCNRKGRKLVMEKKDEVMFCQSKSKPDSSPSNSFPTLYFSLLCWQRAYYDVSHLSFAPPRPSSCDAASVTFCRTATKIARKNIGTRCTNTIAIICRGR